MPKRPTGHGKALRPGPAPSIRDQLEALARRQNPRLARRLAARLEERKAREPQADEGPSRIMRWQDRTLLILAALLLALLVIRSETAAAGWQGWGLLLEGEGESRAQLAVDTDIQIDITGLAARVEVTQRFDNSGDTWSEGIYRFPLPQGAAVDRLRIRVGERLLEGEIQPNDSARRSYQHARDAGRAATLVRQQRRNQFETRLANIGPNEAVEVTIGYLQSVDYSDAGYRLSVPLTFTPSYEPQNARAGESSAAPGPEPYLEAAPGSGHGLRLRANLVGGIDLAAIESPYHDVRIRRVDNGYQIELLGPGQLTDRDFELNWTPALQSRPSASLTTFDDGDSVYAQLMLAPPLADAIEPQAREVVLVVDTSGSMEGASLEQARAALSHALGSLGEDDYFNLLAFNSGTSLAFGRSVPLTASGLYAARDFIAGLEAGGGTEMAPALSVALSLPAVPGLVRQVVFITDGAVRNEAELLLQVADDLGQARLFTVAIGPAPNSWFMRKAAEIGRGTFLHIGKPEDVARRMSTLWKRIRLPALTDVCVDWGMPAESYPEIIPDLYAGESLWLIARLPAEPTLIGLCGALDGRDWGTTVNGWDASAGSVGGDNLAKLWARKKIEALEDGLMFGADPELSQLEMTGLALDYGLLTRFTSLVAVDRTVRRGSGEALLRSVVPGLLPAGASTRLASYPPTAAGWVAQLALSALVLLLATAMLVCSGRRPPASGAGFTPSRRRLAPCP